MVEGIDSAVIHVARIEVAGDSLSFQHVADFSPGPNQEYLTARRVCVDNDILNGSGRGEVDHWYLGQVE